TRLGGVEHINPKLIESLYAGDLAYLQEVYRRLNEHGHTRLAVTCPHCQGDFEVETASLGGGRATPRRGWAKRERTSPTTCTGPTTRSCGWNTANGSDGSSRSLASTSGGTSTLAGHSHARLARGMTRGKEAPCH